MESTAFFLVIIILVALILIAVGIYLVLVLNEIRSSARRFNNILNHVDSILEIVDTKIARPAGSLLSLLGAAREVLEVLRGFQQKKGEHEHGESQPQ